jgi:hypothetical protein
MNLRTQCTELGVKLPPIAKDTGFSLPYVAMVVNGERNSSTIVSAVLLAIEKRKKVLRQIVA